MKNLFSKIMVVGALLLGVASSSHATSSIGTITGPSTNSIINTNQLSIKTVTFANPGTNGVFIKLFDAPYTNMIWSSTQGYTNQTTSVGNYTNIYVDINGNSTTNVYSNVLNTVVHTVTGTTNSYPVLYSGYIAAGSTVVWTPSVPANALFGVLSTNGPGGTNTTITVDWTAFK